MLNGKELIIATRPYAKEDRRKSWLYTWTTLLLLVGAFLGALYPFHWGIRTVFCVLEALLLARMFVIYHDYLHLAILRKSIMANLIFTFFGFYMLTPRSIWKRSHDHHHKHNSKLFTSNIGSFPIVTKEKFNFMSRKERLNYLFIRHPLTIAFGYIFAFTWGMSILSLLRSPTRHWDSLLALIFHFGLAVVLFLNFGLAAMLFSLIIPVTLAHGLGSYLFYVQHNFPEATFEEKEGWTYIGAAMNSTSFLRLSKLMHWFTANIGYHHIHHANAKIPFYRLPEAFDAFPEFQNPKTSSLMPKDIIKCLQLKVWDPELGRMLKRSELRME
jgi:omega-6 fatty acid desaturase (delta-12 desaturase)